MALRRFFGGSPSPQTEVVERPPAPPSETETVRRIVGELESLPPDRARHLAGFAYTLGRAANSDGDISDDETALMEKIVIEHGRIPEAQAILVVEIAKQQERLFGGTEDVPRHPPVGRRDVARRAPRPAPLLLPRRRRRRLDHGRGERRPQRDRQRAPARRRDDRQRPSRVHRPVRRRQGDAGGDGQALTIGPGRPTDQARRRSIALGPSRRPTSASSSES